MLLLMLRTLLLLRTEQNSVASVSTFHNLARSFELHKVEIKILLALV